MQQWRNPIPPQVQAFVSVCQQETCHLRKRNRRKSLNQKSLLSYENPQHICTVLVAHICWCFCKLAQMWTMSIIFRNNRVVQKQNQNWKCLEAAKSSNSSLWVTTLNIWFNVAHTIHHQRTLFVFACTGWQVERASHETWWYRTVTKTTLIDMVHQF